MTIEEQIISCEKRLLEAVKNSDVFVLDELLHDNLLFTIPSGQTITKSIDLETHRSGAMTVRSIAAGEQLIHFIDDTAIVSVLIELSGAYLAQAIDGKFRYIRVWKLTDGRWKVIAGSCIQV